MRPGCVLGGVERVPGGLVVFQFTEARAIHRRHEALVAFRLEDVPRLVERGDPVVGPKERQSILDSVAYAAEPEHSDAAEQTACGGESLRDGAERVVVEGRPWVHRDGMITQFFSTVTSLSAWSLPMLLALTEILYVIPARVTRGIEESKPPAQG